MLTVAPNTGPDPVVARMAQCSQVAPLGSKVRPQFVRLNVVNHLGWSHTPFCLAVSAQRVELAEIQRQLSPARCAIELVRL